MSASFPQIAFWLIFPLAAIIVLTGWILTIIVAVKRLRLGKDREGNTHNARPSHFDRSDSQPDWEVIETVSPDGTHFVPLV